MIKLSTPQACRYGWTVCLTTLLIMGVTLAFNVMVDPYGMYRLADIAGFNHHKPAIYNRVRLAKAYEVRRLQPGTVILGTSRTHLGIRPSSPSWPSDGLPVYNLAFDGATTKEMDAYLRHAQAVHPLRRVLLGLDTYHLTNAPGAVQQDFDSQLLLKDPSLWSYARVVMGDLKLLISYDTLMEGVSMLRAQEPSPAQWFSPDGQRLGEVYFHQPSEHYRTLGPRAYFDEIDKLEVRFKLAWRIPQSHNDGAELSPTANADTVTSLGYVQRIIAFCREHDIALMVYITPAHVHQLEIASATGEWSAIEHGKRALVQLLAEDASQHPTAAAFPLYDFGSYSSITTEALPSPGSDKEMRYYWESSHFKAEVGDLVLRRIFQTGDVPTDFGVRLDKSSINDALARTREQQQRYEASHPQDVAHIQHEVVEFKRLHGILN